MSGRGGRGGFRGGRGGGGRGPGRDMPMGDISFQEMQDAARAPAQLVPNADVVPTLAPPTDKEVRNAVFQLDYLRHQRFSPYWPTLGARTLKPTASAAGSKPTASGVEPADATHNKASLKQVKMQKEVFPQDVWRAYMDGETKRALRAARRQARTKIDWAVFEAAGAGEGAEGAVEGAGVSDDDVGDYEDEVDDDYNQNYFDPGDDDDDGGDDGGDEGGGTFE